MENKTVSLQCPFIKSLEKENTTYTNTDYVCNSHKTIPLTLEELTMLCVDRQKNNHPPILSQ